MKQAVNVRAAPHNATGDGKTDDKAAIVSAIAAAIPPESQEADSAR